MENINIQTRVCLELIANCENYTNFDANLFPPLKKANRKYQLSLFANFKQLVSAKIPTSFTQKKRNEIQITILTDNYNFVEYFYDINFDGTMLKQFLIDLLLENIEFDIFVE